MNALVSGMKLIAPAILRADGAYLLLAGAFSGDEHLIGRIGADIELLRQKFKAHLALPARRLPKHPVAVLSKAIHDHLNALFRCQEVRIHTQRPRPYHTLRGR